MAPPTWATSWLFDRLAPDQGSAYLAFAAGSVALATAVLSSVVHRLSGDVRAFWVCTALAVYALVEVPASTLDSTLAGGHSVLAVMRLVVDLLVGAMLLMSWWSPGRRSAPATPMPGTGLPATYGPATYGPATHGPATDVPAAGLLGLGPAPGVPVGLGLLVLAHVSHDVTHPTAATGSGFSGLRLLALLIVFVEMARVVWRSLRALVEHQQGQREKLRQAEAGLALFAERDHELRNGIAGLAGVTDMLRRPVDETRRRLMRSAVASELSRLDALLDGDLFEAGECEVAGVLREVEVLWQAGGLDIHSAAPGGLGVAVPRAVLAQTMANLLTNCMRHAPGSPVRVDARRAGDRVLILVADSGPGLSPGAEREVFERGTRGAGPTGRGLGLTITRRLLAAHGGGITIDRARPGCVVVVDIPGVTLAGADDHRRNTDVT